ncbi:MAG: alpha/beta hydrolase [Rhodocyclaceae bacterium]|nr:alpha/beta hydrolase [Rhodocyclaceae bacterium]
MKGSTRAALAGAALCFLAAGCAGPDAFGGSRASVEAWAAARGFRAETIQANGFALFALLRGEGAAAILTVYIEGDGAPWPSAFRPPRDPTPLRPLALALAARDPAPAAAYLGRPCQYLDDERRKGCDAAWWSGRRFSPEAVSAMDEAVTWLKARAGAQRVRLIGHSGGGVIAALLAMRRDDVAGLATVAAPLSLGEWTAAHGLTPLEQALDPLTRAGTLPAGAVHFAGAGDAVVPPSIVGAFVRRRGGRLEVIAGFDHDCCWARDWPVLLQRAGLEEKAP